MRKEGMCEKYLGYLKLPACRYTEDNLSIKFLLSRRFLCSIRLLKFEGLAECIT
jgi:hypothetical protein